MNFDLNDEQRAIKDTARELLASRFKLDKVRELAESGSYDDAIWKEIGGLGWAGIAVPEEHGGQGLGIVELMLLCEEVGYACAPLPLFSSAAAGLVIASAGSDEQRERWLPELSSGQVTAGIPATAPEDDSVMIDADGAAVLAFDRGEGPRLAEPSEVEISGLDLIDRTRRYSQLSGEGGQEIPGEIDWALAAITIAFAGELTGLAQRAMEMAVEYARDREQFGRPIGAYQGVSHACAKMLYDVEEARSLTYYAAWCADAQPESLPLAASMAKARASEAAWDVAAASLQVHGGIAFTWEHDLQFFLKRARVSSGLYGTPRRHRNRVADIAGLGSLEPATA
ncbi:MAG: acyl-CoA dehydrogenase [Solirubrobacterales bacterium]|nr:acyl-CoA dehydrogenase [Solirubrobacterales bacterium]